MHISRDAVATSERDTFLLLAPTCSLNKYVSWLEQDINSQLYKKKKSNIIIPKQVSLCGHTVTKKICGKTTNSDIHSA